MTVPPGSTIGIIGGGQLGRMLAIAAAQLGYKCHVLDPNPNSPAGQVSAQFTCASFDDLSALREFGKSVEVATYEFENLLVAPLDVLGDRLRPSTRSLAIAQDRAREKAFIEGCGARVAPWRSISSQDGLDRAVSELGCPLVLKTRRWGYDGKGQAWIRSVEDARDAWESIDNEPAVAEAGVDFLAEFSVIVARWADGRHAVWDSPQNEHGEGILRRSSVPAGEAVISQMEEAGSGALRIAEALQHIGVLTVEYFAEPRGSARQRDRTAGSQQRPLDDRRFGHLAVRATYSSDLRSSSRTDRPRGSWQPNGQSHRS